MADPAAATAATTTDPTASPAPTGAGSVSGAADAAATAKPDAAKPDATLLASGDGKPDAAAATPADWPADWRSKLAGEDKATLKQLERLGSPVDMFKSYRALQQKLSTGELKTAATPFPEKGTDEEKAAWRKESGLPDKPEDYKIEAPNGFVFGEADKPMLESFQKHAHGLNWSPSQLNQAVAWYAAEQEQIAARRHEQDAAFRQSSEDTLRSEFGNEYRANLNAVQNFLASAPTGLADRLLGARDPDGKLLGDNPDLVRWLARASREINPVSTLSPAAGDPSKTLTARKTELDALIADRSSAYYKGPNADKLQTEYREILTYEERMKSRAA